jgi:hypothetical protein
MMWRLQLFFQRVGRRRLLVIAAAAILVALVAAGAVVALTRGGEPSGSAGTTATNALPGITADVFYVRGTAAKATANGCSATIHYAWKPDYNANLYIGGKAKILVSGPEVGGVYSRPFTKKGITLDVGPVHRSGQYVIWSAKILSVKGDTPGNDTTIQSAPTPDNKCG